MNVLNVKKIGGTGLVFIDPSTDQPHSVPSYNADCPDELFPFTAKIEDILVKFGAHYQINFLEPPEANLPTSKRVRASAEDLQGMVQGAGTPPTPPIKPAFVVAEQLEVLNHALKQVEMLLVRIEVAEGKKAKSLREEYFFIRRFVLKLFPGLAEQISSLEVEYGND